VDAEARGAAIGGEHHAATFHLAHEAKAALALVQLAVARAEIALHAAVGQRVPPAAGIIRHSGPLVTRERKMRQRLRRTSSARPASRATARRNWRLSGIPSHTCARKVARRPSSPSMMPSPP